MCIIHHHSLLLLHESFCALFIKTYSLSLSSLTTTERNNNDNNNNDNNNNNSLSFESALLYHTNNNKNKELSHHREHERIEEEKEERSWCDSNNINDDARKEGQRGESLKVVNADDEKREQQPCRTVRALVCSFIIFEKKTTEEKTF